MQQAKDISEKASLGNLCRSSQNLTYEAWCLCSTFLQQEQIYGKKRQATKALAPVCRRHFYLETIEIHFRPNTYSLFSLSQKETEISGPPHKSSLSSTALLPPSPVTLCLKPIHWRVCWFILFFQPENVLLFCKCFRAVILCRPFSSYFWRPESAFGHTICSSMVTSEKINPFIKKAWPGSNYRLALDSYIPLISQLWRNY